MVLAVETARQCFKVSSKSFVSYIFSKCGEKYLEDWCLSSPRWHQVLIRLRL